jgi:hypothetical protein
MASAASASLTATRLVLSVARALDVRGNGSAAIAGTDAPPPPPISHKQTELCNKRVTAKARSNTAGRNQHARGRIAAERPRNPPHSPFITPPERPGPPAFISKIRRPNLLRTLVFMSKIPHLDIRTYVFTSKTPRPDTGRRSELISDSIIPFYYNFFKGAVV